MTNGPHATLREAADLLRDGDHEECAHRLCAYFGWRANGGFGSADTDHKAMRVLIELGEKADDLAAVKAAT